MKALVRGIPESFAGAISAAAPAQPIDVARARAQHAAYVVGLQALGLAVETLPGDASYPDCCFIEDTAVVAGGKALVTRSAAPSRHGEGEAVAAALAGRVEVLAMAAPATLDGGDCLRLGDTFYVGRSRRSNDAGRARLAEVFGRVVAVDMPEGVLHLKSVCSPLDDETVLVAEGWLPAGIFAGARVLTVPRAEEHAANAVAWGRGALVAAGCPRTEALIAAAGFRTLPVDTGEMRKADGALTCMSLLIT